MATLSPRHPRPVALAPYDPQHGPSPPPRSRRVQSGRSSEPAHPGGGGGGRGRDGRARENDAPAGSALTALQHRSEGARRVLEGCSSRLATAARERLAAGIAAHATAVGRLLLPAALLASLAALLAALLALLRLVALLARRYARTLLGVLPLPALVPRRPLRRPLLHALARRRTVRRRGGRRRRRRREPKRGLAVLGFRLPRRRLAVLRWAARVLRASSAEVVGRQPPPSARGRLLPLRRRGACVFVRRERRVARDELRLEERLLAPRRVEVALRHLEPPLPRLARAPLAAPPARARRRAPRRPPRARPRRARLASAATSTRPGCRRGRACRRSPARAGAGRSPAGRPAGWRCRAG
mmetsp:Transcript_41513/g.128013  ORF Transcript_41513/g.128013 Transcript_41513/m.128013 type:complete len:356 (-) Transcript_41513:894-1961(-)